MKKLSILGMLTIVALSSFCQHAQLTISDDFKIAEKGNEDQTVTHSVFHNNFFYSATNSGREGGKWAFTKLYDLKYGITLSKFDRNMNKVKEVDLENGDKVFGLVPPELIFINQKLCLAYFKLENRASFSLYIALVDESDLSLKSEKKIADIQQENVGIFKMEDVLNKSLALFVSSPDNTKTMIACLSSPMLIQTFIINNNLEVQNHADLRVNATGADISSAVLTNDNLECIVLRSESGTRVVCNTVDGKKTEARITPLGNLNPYHTRATLSNDGKTIYVYSTSSLVGDDDNSCNGLMVSLLDCSTTKLSRPLAYEFSPEQIQAISEKGGGTKHRKEYSVYNFTPGLMEMDNGDLVMLGSPEDISTSTTTSAPNMNGQTHMVSATTFDIGPVIAFFLDKNGKQFDYALVPRKVSLTKGQSSGSGRLQMVQSPNVSQSYSGFNATKLGSNIVIVYNDAEDNVTRDVNQKIVGTHTPGDLVLAEALLSKEKKMEYRKQIGKNLSGNYTYFLGSTIPTSSSSIIFPIGKEGANFNARKTFYTNWCFLDVK